jgi:hypothetical protein
LTSGELEWLRSESATARALQSVSVVTPEIVMNNGEKADVRHPGRLGNSGAGSMRNLLLIHLSVARIAVSSPTLTGV